MPTVYLTAIDYRKGCAPMIGTLPLPEPIAGALSTSAVHGLKAGFYLHRTNYQDTLAVYNGLIDFGNTDSLITVINASTDTATLYSTLSGGSPYISKAAINAVGNHVKLPRYSIMLLLIQNPDDLRDSIFLASMQNYYSLSSGDMSALTAAAANTTSRTATEQSMEADQSTMAMEANQILTALKSPMDTTMSAADTTWPNISTDSTSVYYMLDSNAWYAGADSIDTWLRNTGSLWSYYDRVWYYNSLNQVSVADSIFSRIGHILPAGSQPDTATYVTCGKLWNAIKSAESHGRNVYSLDSAEIASLDTSSVPVFTYNRGTKMIYALTSSLGTTTTTGTITIEPLVAPCSDKDLGEGRVAHGGTNMPPPITNINGNQNQQFLAYPNPTSGIVTFSYNVPDAGANMKVAITNIVGEIVAEIQMAGKAGSVYWDPRNLPAGVYLYQARSDKGIISKGKLVVVR